MPMMICPRNYLLRTLSGHMIRFQADVPKFVPDSVVSDALAVNILPVEGKVRGEDTPSDHRKPVRVEITGALRDAIVLRAISDLAVRNDTKDFDGGGRPKIPAITELTGLAINAKEREVYWEKYKQLKSDGEDMPDHKHADIVTEIQYLRTPKELLEYAELLGLDPAVFKGWPLAEQKQALISAALKQ